MAKSLSHSKWMCKYQIVFSLKYQRKIIYNELKKHTTNNSRFMKMERNKNRRKLYDV